MFEIYLADDGWRWRLKTRNGKVVGCGHRSYKWRSGAYRAVLVFHNTALIGKEADIRFAATKTQEAHVVPVV